jgi:RNA polymerase sigma-70 factor (ECF subfamily)
MRVDISFVTRPSRESPPTASRQFERFFQDHYPAVVRIAFGVTRDAQLAQDVAQDVFISALRRFPDPARTDHARAWVRVAAVHVALNMIRGERRRERHEQLAGAEPTAAGPEEMLLDREEQVRVRLALRRLPRRAATVLVLRHSGLSYAEVAAAMNAKVSHVGTMLRRAESALRKELENATRP